MEPRPQLSSAELPAASQHQLPSHKVRHLRSGPSVLSCHPLWQQVELTHIPFRVLPQSALQLPEIHKWCSSQWVWG